jgi:hypothetical protein
MNCLDVQHDEPVTQEDGADGLLDDEPAQAQLGMLIPALSATRANSRTPFKISGDQ